MSLVLTAQCVIISFTCLWELSVFRQLTFLLWLDLGLETFKLNVRGCCKLNVSVCHVITANWRSHNLTMYSWSGPSMMKLHLKEHCKLLPDLYFPNFCPGQVCCCWRFHIIIEPLFLVCIVSSKLVVQKLAFQCIMSCSTLWWSY